MELFDGVINNVVDFLSNDTRLSEMEFVSAFRRTSKPVPLLKTLVTVGINGVDLLEQAVGQYLGMKNGTEVYGKKANICLCIKIHCPIRLGGEKCAEEFSKICNALIFGEFGYRIRGFNCKDIYYEAKPNCFILDCLLNIESFITESPEQLSISNIIVKGEI